MEEFFSKKKTDLFILLESIYTILKPFKHYILLIMISLLINLFTLMVSKKSYFCSGLIAPHGEIAYNLYAHNSIGVNNDRLEYLLNMQRDQQRLVEYHELPQKILQLKPTTYRSVNDTIGYGVLLGVVWKCTHSLSYYDIRYLQIVLFCIAMIYIYQIGLLFFNNAHYAFISSIIFLSLHALVFINVRALRDSWALYGLVILFYDFLSFYYKKKSAWSLRQCIHLFLFCLCVWLRPTLIITLMSFGLLCIKWHKTIASLWISYCASVIFLFCIPFCIYNNYAYNHYFVSCTGHDLLTGLGEFNNPWDIKLSDKWVAGYMYNKYGLTAGTSLYDTQCKNEFLERITKNPFIYCKHLMRRAMQLIIFYAMIHEWQEYNIESSSLIKQLLVKSLYAIDCLQRLLCFGCWYILLGWLGIILLCAHQQWYEALLLILCALSGANKFFSHLETRYLIAHYSFFCFSIMYLLLVIKNNIYKYISA